MRKIPAGAPHGGRHGDNKIKYDLSVNINPLGMPEGVRRVLEKGREIFTDYPDPQCRELRDKLGMLYGLGPGHIVCGNGASDLIYRIAEVYSPGKALIPVPAFSEYERALKMKGWELEFLETSEEDGFALTEEGFCRWMASSAEKGEELPSAVFLCNPCNPSGKLLEPALLKEVCSWCSQNHALMVIDECFLEFSDRQEELSMISYLRDSKLNLNGAIQGKNRALFPVNEGPFLKNAEVIVLRAFTKIYAMAGLRLGYCLCSDESSARLLMSAGPPWSVSGPAQAAGIEALKDREYLKRTQELISEERTYLAKQLEKLSQDNLTLFESGANYILFQGPPGLLGKMEENGIAIRDCTDYRGLELSCHAENMCFYRMAVRDRYENDIVLEVMRRCLDWL